MSYEINKDKHLTKTELDYLVTRLANDLSRDGLMIKLALHTGARAQEILNITKNDLDDNNRCVFIRGLKGSDSQEIPLDKTLYNALKALALNVDGDILFNISYSQLKRIWANYTPNKNKSFKCLRHTRAVNLYRDTGDLQLVKTLLRHKQISNTMVYADYVYKTTELKKLLKVR